MYVFKRGYRRKYVYGGSGLLEKIISIGSKAALPMASKALQSIDVGKIAKDIGNNVARKAVNTIFKEPTATEQQMALRRFIEEGKRKRGSGIRKPPPYTGVVPIESLVLKILL